MYRTRRSRGGGVIVRDGKFVAESKSAGKSAVGAIEEELADFLDLRGVDKKDFYEFFHYPSFHHPSNATRVTKDGEAHTFEDICYSISQSQLRHVGELLTKIIQTRIQEVRRKQILKDSFAPGSEEYNAEVIKTKNHLQTLAMYIVARKYAAYIFRRKLREDDAMNPNPLIVPARLTGTKPAYSSSPRSMDLFGFLTTVAPDHRDKVTTYEELKQNLDMLPRTDFKKVKLHSSRRKSSDDEHTSSYSDDRHNATHIYERPHRETNATRKQRNAARRAVRASRDQARIEEEQRVKTLRAEAKRIFETSATSATVTKPAILHASGIPKKQKPPPAHTPFTPALKPTDPRKKPPQKKKPSPK